MKMYPIYLVGMKSVLYVHVIDLIVNDPSMYF